MRLTSPEAMKLMKQSQPNNIRRSYPIKRLGLGGNGATLRVILDPKRWIISERAFTALLVASGIYVLIMLLGPSVLNDDDIYTHIETGRWIISHADVPTADPFSHTMGGSEWIVYEWLADLIYAVTFSVGGWPGVLVISAAAIALAFAIQMRFLLD